VQERRTDSEILRNIERSQAAMHASLFGVDGNNGFVRNTNDRLNVHSSRISELQKWMWALGGGGSVIAFLLAHHLLAAH
jgi:hypothetical protein